MFMAADGTFRVAFGAAHMEAVAVGDALRVNELCARCGVISSKKLWKPSMAARE